MQVLKGLIHYFLREKQWKSAIKIIDEEMKLGKDPYLLFFRSISNYKIGSVIDAIRDVKICLNSKDMKFSSTVAYIYYLENSSQDNREISNMIELYNKLKSDTKTLSSPDVLSSMRFFLYMDELDKYFEMEDLFDSLPNNTNGEDLLVKGWNLCYSNSDEELKGGLEMFDKYINEFGILNYDGIMGKIKSLERLKKNEECLDFISNFNEVMLKFYPMMIEKAKIFVNLSEYENAMDLIKSYPKVNHFEIYKISSLCYLLNDGDFKLAISELDKLWNMIINQEPSNPDLYYSTAKLFSRICDKNSLIISKCEIMIDKAITYNPRSCEYLIEKGYYRLILGDVFTAEKLFLEATSIDKTNKNGLIKVVFIKILQEDLPSALENISFLKDFYKSGNLPLPPELMLYDISIKIKDYIKKCNLKTSQDKIDYIKYIDEVYLPVINDIISKHISIAKQYYFNKYDLLISTNYDFLLDVSRLSLEFFPINWELPISQKEPPLIISKAKKILDSILTQGSKYFLSAYMLDCKLKYLLQERKSIIPLLDNIIKSQPASYIDAYILYIFICNEANDLQKSKEIIQNALLNSSQKAKSNIHFWIAKLQMEFLSEEYRLAEKTLDECLEISKSLLSSSKNEKNKIHISSTSLSLGLGIASVSIFKFTQNDRHKLYMLHIQILIKQGKSQEAQPIISQLISEGVELGDNLLVLNAEVALKTQDVRKAVNLLKKIKPEPNNEELFKQSREKLADIYLTHLLDRRLYSWCYSEILEHYKSFENYMKAAEAEMKIDSPTVAVAYYKEALKLKPDDTEILRDLGRALIATHDYSNAEDYFKEKVEKFKGKVNENNASPFFDLIEDFSILQKKLGLINMNKYPELIEFLSSIIQFLRDTMKKFPDLPYLKLKLASLLYILSNSCRLVKLNEIKFSHIALDSIVENLEEANKMNKEYISKIKKNEKQIEKTKSFMSKISIELGVYYKSIESNIELAEKSFIEALQYSSNTSEEALTNIIKVNIKQQKLNEAQKYADMLIRLNENNEENIKLLITVISNKLNNEAASQYLEDIILKQLTCFKLIEIYIDLIRRTGKIFKAKEILSKCENKLKFVYSPGLIFCKGLLYRYTNETNLALKEFSKIKTDEYYGVKCIEQMLELYINPDNNILLLELSSPFGMDTYDFSKDLLPYNNKDIDFDAVKFLLKELLQKRDDDQTRIYECWVGLLLRDYKIIVKQIEKLQDIVNRNNDNLHAWVLLAMCNLVIGKDSEVRTYLKFLEKTNVNNIMYYTDYERGNLILAYLSMKNNSIPKAIEYLKRIINEINIAQVKAYDYFGMIYEKDGNYKEAINHYEKAWEFSYQNSALMGYKLAVIYLNNRNPIKAVNICNEVIKKYPEYPIHDLSAKAKTYLN